MIQRLIALWMLLPTLASAIPESAPTVLGMKSGVLLRMHVVAQDDTEAMQRLKLTVRDAVQAAYAADGRSGPMLPKAQAMLPALTQAAQAAAVEAGFSGPVTLSIETRAFETRELDGLTIPAGTYPALMIRLGDAQGRNWWGLIDPELALSCAALDGAEGWDWSFLGFLYALLGLEVIPDA